MKKIKYIVHYYKNEVKEKRYACVAAVGKSDYIISVLNELGYRVTVFSPSVCLERRSRFWNASVSHISDCLEIIHVPSLGGKSKLIRGIRYYMAVLSTFFYLLLKTRKNEPVLVYHSLAHRKSILWAKKIRGFKLLLEVEEIYSKCTPLPYSESVLETKVIKQGDAFLFASKDLQKTVSKLKKAPGIVVNGRYSIENIIAPKFNDGRIHIVYSGTFNPYKGGAQIAIECAKSLSKNYCIHILGFGNDDEIKAVKDKIKEIQPVNCAEVKFVGLLDWDDYKKYLQQCHIGLSTQNLNGGDMNISCFPSKILTYMSNGLPVVSGSIPAITESELKDFIYFYHDQSAESIARAIKKVNLEIDTRSILSILNKNFSLSLSDMLSENENN